MTDEDVYVTAERAGLYRLDRQTGREVWHNGAAQRFLSANKKFVYATDKSGRFVVLDRERGTILSTWDARDQLHDLLDIFLRIFSTQ